MRPGAPEGHGGRGGRLVERMGDLLGDRGLAGRLGEQARLVARERFSIDRFVADWDATLGEVAGAR